MSRISLIVSTTRSATAQYFFEYGSVFAAYYVTAIAGVYLFAHFHTSPAVIWIPAGIAATAALHRGYRMSMPVFLAQFLASLSVGQGIETATIFGATYAIQTLTFAYAAHRVGYEPLFDRTRSVILFIGAAFLLTLVSPILSTLIQLALFLHPSIFASITRGWVAGIFSVLVVTPLLSTWLPWRRVVYGRFERYEVGAALAALTLVNIFLFWTPYAKFAGISVIFFIPAVLIWFALSLHPRWIALGISSTAVIGLTGSIVTNALGGALNQQLFSDEIYIGMVAAIFYVFVAVVEERRLAFRELEAAYRTTLASDRAKNEFIAILAHELRNPLAPIVSALELLGLEHQTDEAREIIADAKDNAGMIRRLLDDLLDTARLTQKKFALHKEPVRIGDVIDSSIVSVLELAESKNLKLSVTARARDLVIEADPVRLKQIVMNLLSNACKYTMPGGSVELTCEMRGDDVLFRVRDSGIGIEPALLDRIFEPFKQLNESSRYSGGLGIGLYLTKQLVEMHGGRLAAESAGAGKGSTFTVRIPHKKAVVEPSKAAPEPGDALRILLVDDNEAASRGLQKLLARSGHDVRTISRGTTAFAAVAAFAPDVILLDIGLPDMNGYEVARRLRDSGYDRRIIALTGYGQETDREEARTAGFDAHLTKPVGISDVLAILTETGAIAA